MGLDDKQYDEPWVEIDKVERRRQIRNRLKSEFVHKNYNPFKHMKNEFFSDPADTRFMEIRKHGRLPGAPWKPSLYWGMVAAVFAPIFIGAYIFGESRKPYLEACETLEISYRDREHKI